jgi:diketogulonate reductase-like aldo/keto reductase
VAGAIVGARNATHLQENQQVFSFSLTAENKAAIQNILAQRTGPAGDVFDIERIKDGPHGRIMRYNLNQNT